jgi:hypothetical protein
LHSRPNFATYLFIFIFDLPIDTALFYMVKWRRQVRMILIRYTVEHQAGMIFAYHASLMFIQP